MPKTNDRPPTVRTQQRQFREVTVRTVYIVETLIPTDPGDPVCYLQEVHEVSSNESFVGCR